MDTFKSDLLTILNVFNGKENKTDQRHFFLGYLSPKEFEKIITIKKAI